MNKEQKFNSSTSPAIDGNTMLQAVRVLNLYACLGGNRFKWDEVANIEVTAVELDPELARMYQERFPNDKVIVADAHQYLLDHYKEFDFIWSSPPCPTHSKSRFWAYGKTMPVYPDMKLYEEIIFLMHHALDGQKWVVENVNGYYEPLIKPEKRGTRVTFSLSKNSSKHLKDIFSKYEVDHNDPDFDKTEIHIRLYTIGTIYVSRSQARRVLTGLEKFKKVIFNFDKVPTVGQAFADEIFRVFQQKYPHIVLEPINMNEAVKYMIDRVEKPTS